MSDDHWAISNLLARYAELLNLGRIEEVGELFRYGKITSVGNPTTYTGTDEVVAMYRDSVHFDEKVPDTLIFTTNLQIEVDGDAATSRAYFLVVHQGDEFERRDGRWWFRHRHMLPDLVGDLSTHLNRPLEDYLEG